MLGTSEAIVCTNTGGTVMVVNQKRQNLSLLGVDVDKTQDEVRADSEEWREMQ